LLQPVLAAVSHQPVFVHCNFTHLPHGGEQIISRVDECWDIGFQHGRDYRTTMVRHFPISMPQFWDPLKSNL